MIIQLSPVSLKIWAKYPDYVITKLFNIRRSFSPLIKLIMGDHSIPSDTALAQNRIIPAFLHIGESKEEWDTFYKN